MKKLFTIILIAVSTNIATFTYMQNKIDKQQELYEKVETLNEMEELKEQIEEENKQNVKIYI